MPGGVAGHVDDGEGQFQRRDGYAVAFAQRVGTCRYAFIGWAENGNFSAQGQLVEKFLDATNVVGVMVGADDGRQLKLVRGEVIDDRAGIARVDRRSMPAVMDDPEIIVVERRHGMNDEWSSGCHGESAKMKT